MALRKGHVEELLPVPTPVRCPTKQHTPGLHILQISVQFCKQARQTTHGFGWGNRVVFHAGDTAFGSICVRVSGGATMHPARNPEVILTLLSLTPGSSSVSSPADPAGPNTSHIVCSLSTPCRAPSSLTGPFMTASYCFRSRPLQSNRAHRSNDDHCLLITCQGLC